MSDALLRQNLVELLKMGSAHVTVSQTLAGLKPDNRNMSADHNTYHLGKNVQTLKMLKNW